MSILTLDGQHHGTMADPEKFREQRVIFEKKLQGFLDKFQEDIRESAVVKADIGQLKDTYHQRWNNECDVAERRGMAIDRDAFVKQVDGALAQLERRRKFTGAITPEALEMIGFRPWKDGTWRTHELMVERVGTDWRITVIGDLVRDYTMPNIIRFMDALDMKVLNPWNEADPNNEMQPAAPKSLLTRLFNRS